MKVSFDNFYIQVVLNFCELTKQIRRSFSDTVMRTSIEPVTLNFNLADKCLILLNGHHYKFYLNTMKMKI